MTANDDSTRDRQEGTDPGAPTRRLAEARKQLRIVVEEIDDSEHAEDLERAEAWIAAVGDQLGQGGD